MQKTPSSSSSSLRLAAFAAALTLPLSLSAVTPASAADPAYCAVKAIDVTNDLPDAVQRPILKGPKVKDVKLYFDATVPIDAGKSQIFDFPGDDQHALPADYDGKEIFLTFESAFAETISCKDSARALVYHPTAGTVWQYRIVDGDPDPKCVSTQAAIDACKTTPKPGTPATQPTPK